MKVLFKNTTKYTKENCNNFLEFHTNKYGKKELIELILVIICIGYIIVFNIININWILLLMAILIGIGIYFYKKNNNIKSKKQKNTIKEFTFYFYDKYIKIKYKRNFERLKYFQLHKVFETEEYFFLYLDEKQSLILSKSGFEVGNPKGFSKFIKGKCPFKYKNEDK